MKSITQQSTTTRPMLLQQGRRHKYYRAIAVTVLMALGNIGLAEETTEQSQAQLSKESSGEQSKQQQSSYGLEEIIVTATKIGATSLQKTPLAITAFSSETLDRSVANDIRDLAHLTPGLTISENTGSAQITIRGIGTNTVNTGGDASSTIHSDGVYLARPTSGFNNFIDVERVEILRGPQGTLYGRNSVGGTINIISRKPSFETFKSKLQFTTGNEELTRSEAHISGPIYSNPEADQQLAASAAFQYSNHKAFRENVVASGNDVDDDESLGFRGQLRGQLSEKFEAILRTDYFKQQTSAYGYHTFVEPAPMAPIAQSVNGDFSKVALNFPQSYDQEIWGISLDIEGEINQYWSLKSITAYRESDTYIIIDSDASELDLLRTFADERQDQTSQEINLVRNFDKGSIIFGAYYFQENATSPIRVQVRQAGIQRNATPVLDTMSWALFSQANYQLSDKFSVTAGIRYTEEEKEFLKNDRVVSLATGAQIADLSFPVETGEYRKVTPKLGLEYQYQENLLAYASVTRGFKSGGFNLTAVQPGGYDEELLWSYELGIKSDWLGNRLRFNANGFYYDYDDLQVQAFVVPGQTDVTNAASAEVKGVEIELSGRPLPALDLSLSLSYLDAEYRDYDEAPVSGGGITDASGNRLNNSPEWSYSLAAQYMRDLHWGSVYLRGDYSWQDDVFFTADNNNIDAQSSYGLLNGSLGYVSTGGRLELALWGRNLTDEEYVTGTAQFTLVSAGRAGFPRTFGVRLSYEY